MHPSTSLVGDLAKLFRDFGVPQIGNEAAPRQREGRPQCMRKLVAARTRSYWRIYNGKNTDKTTMPTMAMNTINHLTRRAMMVDRRRANFTAFISA